MDSPVFLILAHDDPAMLERLLRRLNGIGPAIVHLDQKADKKLFGAAERVPKVRFTSTRVDVRWAGYSMVAATLELLRSALTSFPQASHFVLLSGADYPIKPNSAIKEFFHKNRGCNFIRYFQINKDTAHYWRSVTGIHLQELLGARGSWIGWRALRATFEKAVGWIERPLPSGVTPYFGSQWWAVTPECARYVLEFTDTRTEYRKYWRLSFAPDEHFFHTIIGNSRFAARSSGLKPFEGRGTWRMANLHVVDPSLTKLFTGSDYEILKDSERLFVRKVNTVISGTLLDKLDADHKEASI